MQIKILRERTRQFTKWFYTRLARRRLLRKKQQDVAIFNIMEAYLTEKVLSGDERRREELGEMQAKIEEFEKFIKFVKNL